MTMRELGLDLERRSVVIVRELILLKMGDEFDSKLSVIYKCVYLSSAAYVVLLRVLCLS